MTAFLCQAIGRSGASIIRCSATNPSFHLLPASSEQALFQSPGELCLSWNKSEDERQVSLKLDGVTPGWWADLQTHSPQTHNQCDSLQIRLPLWDTNIKKKKKDQKGVSNGAGTQISIAKECCLSDMTTESAPHWISSNLVFRVIEWW